MGTSVKSMSWLVERNREDKSTFYTLTFMNTPNPKNSQTRLIVASTLFALSILASFLFTYTSHLGEKYWVLTQPIAKGVQIGESDLTLVKASLASPIRSYLSSSDNPVGSISQRNLRAGELLSEADISIDSSLLTTESISLAVRAADIPLSVQIGDLVTLYQVHDARNGEVVQPPNEVISAVFIQDISRKSANFGSDIALTISLNRRDVPAVLQASASGRIVVATSHG
jgi:hypothetical protein